MKKMILAVLLAVAGGLPLLLAHCEIPCGIYNDSMRIAMIAEHITTVEKSIAEIKTIEAAREKNYNQLVRWINNKDLHATQIQEIVWQYFMTQRIKPAAPGTPGYDKYVRELTLLHRLSVYAMKSKQSLDRDNVVKMRELLEAFRQSYLGPAAAAHDHHH